MRKKMPESVIKTVKELAEREYRKKTGEKKSMIGKMRNMMLTKM